MNRRASPRTWLDRLYDLRRDNPGSHERPHKPVLLLAIMDQVVAKKTDGSLGQTVNSIEASSNAQVPERARVKGRSLTPIAVCRVLRAAPLNCIGPGIAACYNPLEKFANRPFLRTNCDGSHPRTKW